jgi:hypothetical protein
VTRGRRSKHLVPRVDQMPHHFRLARGELLLVVISIQMQQFFHKYASKLDLVLLALFHFQQLLLIICPCE